MSSQNWSEDFIRAVISGLRESPEFRQMVAGLIEELQGATPKPVSVARTTQDRQADEFRFLNEWGLSTRAARALSWRHAPEQIRHLTRPQLEAIDHIGQKLAQEIVDKRAAVFAAKQQ